MVVLADGTKLTHAPVKLAELDVLSTIITNGPVPVDLEERCADLGIDIVNVQQPLGKRRPG